MLVYPFIATIGSAAMRKAPQKRFLEQLDDCARRVAAGDTNVPTLLMGLVLQWRPILSRLPIGNRQRHFRWTWDDGDNHTAQRRRFSKAD